MPADYTAAIKLLAQYREAQLRQLIKDSQRTTTPYTKHIDAGR